MSTYRETKLKKLEKEFYILEQAILNTYNLFKRTNNDNTSEKLKKRVQSIKNKMNNINHKTSLLKEKMKNEKPINKAQASKEREAFKRKSNSGFNTPPKKKSAKKFTDFKKVDTNKIPEVHPNSGLS